MVLSLAGALILLLSAGLTDAQFPPTPEGVTTIKSKHHNGIKVSYKEPGICETTPGVKSYAGKRNSMQSKSPINAEMPSPIKAMFIYQKMLSTRHTSTMAIPSTPSIGSSNLAKTPPMHLLPSG